jgi:hypothetical protein
MYGCFKLLSASQELYCQDVRIVFKMLNYVSYKVSVLLHYLILLKCTTQKQVNMIPELCVRQC